ncbi:hypothetical protein BD560DRAFT_426234 [Blakeslea trispora]|nr:hypothetical protein BD560DRAFT_426234 [Blakeslea trispora]
MDAEQAGYWKNCDEAGICHCDFRFAIRDCEESKIFRILYIAVGSAFCILSIIGICAVYFRVHYKGQRLIEIRNGFPRPKPIESMTTLGVTFSILQLIHCVLVLTNGYSSPIFRSFWFELSYVVAYWALMCYPFGVVYMLVESNEITHIVGIRGTLLVDILLSCAFFLPCLGNLTCGLLVGIYNKQGNMEMTAKVTKILFYLWTLNCGGLGLVILAAGIFFLRLVNKHFLTETTSILEQNRIKEGAFRVKLIVVSGTTCLWIFAALASLCSVYRETILCNARINTAVGITWMSSAPICVLFIEVAIIVNSGITTQLNYLILKSSETYPIDCKRSAIPDCKLADDSTMAKMNERLELEAELGLTMKGLAMAKDTQIEQDQYTYNSTVDRVRTPPPMHNRK